MLNATYLNGHTCVAHHGQGGSAQFRNGGAFKSVISTATLRHTFDALGGLQQACIGFVGQQEMGCAVGFGHFQPFWIHINGNDFSRSSYAGTLDHVEPDTSSAQYDHRGSRFDFCGIDHRAVAGHYSAAHYGGRGERHRHLNFDTSGFAYQGVLGHSAQTKSPFDGLSLVSGRAKGSMPTTDFVACCYGGVAFAEVLVALQALKTFVAGNGPVEHYWIARLQGTYGWAASSYNACAFVPHHQSFAPGLGVPIGMANSGGFDFNQNFISLRRLNLDGINDKMAFAVGNSGLAPHQISGLRGESMRLPTGLDINQRLWSASWC